MTVPCSTFTLPEVAAAAEIEYRTLHMWLRRGLIRASIAKASGSGTPNLFDERDLLEIRVLADLRRIGAEVSVLERTAQALQGRNDRLSGDEVLIINGTVDIVSDDAVATHLAQATPSFVVATKHAKQALLARRLV